MLERRREEKQELQREMMLSNNLTAGSENRYSAGKGHSPRENTTKATSRPPKTPQKAPQASTPRVSSNTSPFIKGSVEPYISVGCLKCGAPDHVATNRNCPRPRKAAPVAYGALVSPITIKKIAARSPKRPAAGNHHLKEAKMGDSTKFWYYISDDSDDEVQSSPKSAKKIRIDNDGKYQGQIPATNTTHGGYYVLEDNGFETMLDPVDDAMKLNLSTRRTSHKIFNRINENEVMRIRQEAAIQKSVSYEQQGVQNLLGKTPDLRKIHVGNGLGPIPFLPWKPSDSSPLSPVKQTIHSHGNDAQTDKSVKQKKVSKLEDGDHETHETAGPLQKKSRKIKQALYTTPAKTTGFHELYDTRYPNINANHGLDNSPQISRQSTSAQFFRYPAPIPRHTTQTSESRSSAQMINDSLLAEEMEITKFKYNYMGARNYVEEPRIRYAPDRVQGWRECRSMGTGLE